MMKICLALIAALTLMFAVSMVSNYIFRDEYPDKLAIDVPGFDGPLVNRATVQRSWPNGLDDLSARAQLRTHMGDIENLEVAKPLTSVTTRASEPVPDLATLLASADATNGERRARICAACHTFNDGGRNGVGPNLWDVLGREIATTDSYNYSNALSIELGSWTLEKIDAYLLNPNNEIPGNKMAFSGLRRARDRADVIAYLRMQSAAPIPLPEPVPVDQQP